MVTLDKSNFYPGEEITMKVHTDNTQSSVRVIGYDIDLRRNWYITGTDTYGFERHSVSED